MTVFDMTVAAAPVEGNEFLRRLGSIHCNLGVPVTFRPFFSPRHQSAPDSSALVRRINRELVGTGDIGSAVPGRRRGEIRSTPGKDSTDERIVEYRNGAVTLGNSTGSFIDGLIHSRVVEAAGAKGCVGTMKQLRERHERIRFADGADRHRVHRLRPNVEGNRRAALTLVNEKP